MSIKCLVENLSVTLKQVIHKELTIEITPKNRYYKGAKKFITVYGIDSSCKYVNLPYYYAKNSCKLYPDKLSDYPKAHISYKDDIPLREEQRKVKSEAISLLNNTGCCILSLYTGFGKTCMSIYLASRLSLKTLYINNRITIIEQLKESIEKFTYSKVQIIKPGMKLNPISDFYIVNAINVPKFKEGFFNDIGLLIIDEIHCMLSEVLSKCLFHINPKYLIGLSATPYRQDGFDLLFDLYFGPEKIIRTLNRYHKVYKIETSFVPDIQMSNDGTLDWNAVLTSQADNKERNDKIVDIICKYSDRNFIVICKRVSQIKYIEKQLNDKEVVTSALYGNKKTYIKDAKVIIGTIQKLGTGFDSPNTNALLLATDMESYFIQTLGRSMRTPEVEPIIFDIVDKFNTLNKHWKTREKIYTSHGGKIFSLDWDSLVEK